MQYILTMIVSTKVQFDNTHPEHAYQVFHRLGLVIDNGKQILIQEGDHYLLRLLWFKILRDEQPEAIPYRFCHLIFRIKNRITIPTMRMMINSVISTANISVPT